jgi:hypothetical protein
MRPHTEDPTAGTRARNIHEHPEIPQPNFDPTDPRYGEALSGGREHARAQQNAQVAPPTRSTDRRPTDSAPQH